MFEHIEDELGVVAARLSDESVSLKLVPDLLVLLFLSLDVRLESPDLVLRSLVNDPEGVVFVIEVGVGVLESYLGFSVRLLGVLELLVDCVVLLVLLKFTLLNLPCNLGDGLVLQHVLLLLFVQMLLHVKLKALHLLSSLFNLVFVLDVFFKEFKLLLEQKVPLIFSEALVFVGQQRIDLFLDSQPYFTALQVDSHQHGLAVEGDLIILEYFFPALELLQRS